MSRQATIHRVTAETDIQLQLDLDGKGLHTIATGIPFFDHMLTLWSRHSLIDLEVRAEGDIEVDYHHTVEDTGLVLGQALRQALGDKAGIHRYGSAYLPMDETLARIALDISGRPLLVFRAPEQVPPIRDFPFQLVEEFLRALASTAGLTLHSQILYGRDSHHMAEAIFKGLGHALRRAISLDPRIEGVLSTKGTLSA